jgi:hypothetical protein
MPAPPVSTLPANAGRTIGRKFFPDGFLTEQNVPVTRLAFRAVESSLIRRR